MGEIVLLENTMTPLGIRKAKISRMGEGIPTSEWLAFVPGEVPVDGVAIHETHDADLDIHTVDLSWPARETIRSKDGIVMSWWWLGGMNVQMGIECAAGVFSEALKVTPGIVLIKKLPKNAPEILQVETQFVAGEIAIKTADWVPPGFIVVTK